jgi:predicted KAP-like P-loop ATPase
MLIPDHETEVDFLNCEAISKTVVELLKDNRKRALTVGIHGDWGAGKSSILKMVQVELSQDSKVACLWFNGWAFQGFEDAKTVLIEATITELMRQRSGISKVKTLERNYSSALIGSRSPRKVVVSLSTSSRVCRRRIRSVRCSRLFNRPSAALARCQPRI